MITIQREFDKSVIDEIKPYFVEDGGYTADICYDDMLAFFNAENPEGNICIITARDNGELRGFLAAYKIYDRCFLNQAFSELAFVNANEGLSMLAKWAIENSCKEIRCETEKNSVLSRALSAWGFELHGFVLRKVL